MVDSITRHFDTPDAWRGPEMQEKKTWIYTLSQADVVELLDAVEVARASGEKMHAWTTDDFPLPALGGKIAGWVEELSQGLGFQLIRGFPVRDHSKELCEQRLLGDWSSHGGSCFTKYGRRCVGSRSRCWCGS